GRTSIVKAGPARRIDGETGAMRPSRVPRRPATSARIEAANCAAFFTMSGGTRSKSRRMSESGGEVLSFMADVLDRSPSIIGQTRPWGQAIGLTPNLTPGLAPDFFFGE